MYLPVLEVVKIELTASPTTPNGSSFTKACVNATVSITFFFSMGFAIVF